MLAAIVAVGALAAPDAGVSARIREAMVAEQSLQGSLDGAWRLRDANGRPLYDLQLVDPVGDGRSLAGACLDVRRGAGEPAGVVGDIRGSRLTLRFRMGPNPAIPIVVDLAKGPRGGWRGWIRTGEAAQTVVLTRN
jgi:hypothetical protein